jgi:hypothetical protein
MKQHFKNYWAIWLLNVLIVVSYFLSVDKIGAHDIIRVAVFEMVLVASFLIKGRYDKTARQVLLETDDRLIVTGVFRKLEFDRREVKKIVVAVDYLSKIFDTSKVQVFTDSGVFSIYTRRLSNKTADV